MSVDRIKGLRQKTANNLYTNLVPFGTDGSLVDMLSGMTLEEENHIGTNHYTKIEEVSETETLIEEIFAKKEEVDAGTAENYYKKETTILEQGDGITVISEKLWFKGETDVPLALVKTKTTTITEAETSTIIEEVLT